MAKKRKKISKSKALKANSSSHKNKINRETDNLENLLLSRLYTTPKSLNIREIQESIPLTKDEHRRLETTLKFLLRSNLIIKNNRNSYTIHKKAPLYEGTIEQNPRGFGFVTPTGQEHFKQLFAKDIYISASQMNHSHHGDKVLVRVIHIKRNGRAEGVVVSILSRGPDTIAGTLHKKNGAFLVYPDDARFPFNIQVDKPEGARITSGDCVIVKYKASGKPSGVKKGEIVEILGSPNTTETQRRLVLQKFHLPLEFTGDILHEIKNTDADFSLIDGREDLRDTAHITIDGEDAKDFDDAIWVTKNKNGFSLVVSIADVSHFVIPGSEIDKEAYKRGTSIYFPGYVTPMLPEKLSNDLCSLKPDCDRFTLSAILDFDEQAQLTNKRFCRSIIRSKHRFTYSTVSKIIEDKDPAEIQLNKDFISQLETAEALADKLKQRRRKRGSIDFNLSEPLFTLSAKGKITSIEKTKRTVAHQIIEEFMLAANEAVADFFSDQSITALFRVHELPDQEKLDNFIKFAKTLDLKLPDKDQSPQFLAKILDDAKESRYEYIINNLLLRSLKQAHYSTKNVGHFGLASTNYTHFTSPIRRYPDLLVHRQLITLLNAPPSQPFVTNPSLQEAGEFLSSCERVAVLAERDMDNRLKTLYMTQFVGQEFEAIISGVSENGIYIEIQNICVSGAISIDFFTDDYYIYDQKNHRLFGEISARIFQIGDPIKVVLIDANLGNQKLSFSPKL